MFFSLIAFFLFSSFIGWVIDTSYRSFTSGKFTHGAAFPVPFCPIYGFGALVILFLAPFLLSIHFVLQYLILVFLLTLVELIGGLFSEHVLRRKLWDYSKQPFHFKGYICLEQALEWGTLGMIYLHALHPYVSNVITGI